MSWRIKGKNGLRKAVVGELEYNDEWMSQTYVTATVISPVPINFEIGDYIEYRGERFEINYDPSKIKSAPRFAKGDAFKYENIKFNSLADELTRCDFLDVVLADNHLHFTGLPKFSFFGTVQDLAGRIQANLDRAYPDKWTVTVSPEYTGKKELNVSIDTQKVWDALSILVNDFETYFTIEGRTITIGAAGVPAAHLFKYGKDNGLYEIEQNAESDQAIVTRLRAYGSTRNLPNRYYNSLSGADGEKLIPNNMAVQHLMLPEFPYTTQDPFIDSKNIDTLGVREGTVFFDGSQEDLEEIYPSIEGMTAEQLKSAGVTCNSTGDLDVLIGANVMTDDGVGKIDKNETQTTPEPSTFKVTVKDLGFDINDCVIPGNSESPTVSFKTGMLGGREFEIVECTPIENSSGDVTSYMLELNRVYDDDVKLWFPYKDYNAAAGDKFVILNIKMPDVYIKAAAKRLKEAAEAWLAKNDYSRSVYSPKVDEIFMARQHDAAMASGGAIKSLHDTLRAGMLMLFEDEDFNIDASIFIDKLVIKEGEGAIPTYEVTLKEEKTVGRLDKMQNQIDSLASGRGQGGVGGYTAGQIRQMIDAYGDTRFLSKIKDDRTPHTISSDRGFEVGNYVSGAGGGAIGIDPETGDSFADVARLWVRVRAFFEELTVVKASVFAGKNYISPGGGIKCTKVEEVKDSGGNVTAYRCYFLSSQDGEKAETQFAVNDQAISETFNAAAGTSNKISNHRYWRLVTAVSNDAYTDDSGNHYGYIDLSATDCEVDSDIPQAGDEICQLGNRNDADRQSAIMFSTVDADAPSVKLFAGVGSGSTNSEHYSLDGKAEIMFGKNPLTGKVYFRLGTSTATHYLDYTQDGGLTVAGKISARSTITDTSGNESSIDQYITDTANELLVVEYSATGADGTWHSTYTNGDRYMRQSSDGGNTWSGPMLISAPDIASKTVEYATSASGTTAPTAGWSTTIPSVAEGQYLWTRTTLTFSDGNSVTSYSVAYQGEDGADAPYTVFQWAKGDYAQPTGTWSDTPLNALPGEFVWMREGVVTPPATTPVWKSGYTRVTGDTGAAGTNYTPNMLTNSKDNKIHVVEKDSDSYKEWRGSTVHLEYKKTYTISARTNAAAFTGDPQDALVSHPNACALCICSDKGSPQGFVNEVVSSADMATDGSKGSVFTWMKPTAGYFLGTNFYKSGTWYVNHVKIEEGDNPNPSWTPHPDEMVGTPGTNGINGQDVFLLDLDNEMVAVTCDADGNVISGLPATINARVFKGGTELTSGVTYRNQGTTLTVSQSGNKFEIKGIGKDRDTLVIEAVVAGLTLRSTVTVYKVKAGADGAPATMYFLEPAESSVTRTAQGGLSVTSLGCRKLYVTGSDQRHLTTANTLTAQIYTNGVAGTETVIAADGVTNNGEVTLTDDTTAVVFSLYKGNSQNKDDMLDRERVPVLTDAFGLSVGGVNLLRKTNSGIINWTTNTSSNGQIVMEPGTPQSRCVFYNNATTAAPDWQMIGFALPADTIKANCYYMLSFKARVLQSNGTAGGALTQPLQLRWQISKNTGGDRLTNVESRTVTYTETRFTIMMRTTGVPTSQHRLWGYISTTGTAWEALEIWDMQLEEGVVATEYKASPLDFNYLTEALKESTTVEGGVILSSLMRLGYTASDAYRVTAGMNGVLAPSTDGTDPAIWAGGDMLDATSDENSSADLDSLAKLMFRHNGNGYMCGGVVRVLDGRILIGRNRKADGTIKSDAEFAQDCIILDEEGLTYVSGGQDRLLVTSAQVGDTFETKVNAVNWSGTATAFDSIALAHYYSKEMILEPVNPEQTASEDGTEALSTTYLETWSWVPTINIAQTKTINIGSGTIAVGTVIEVSSLSTSFSITRSHSEGVQITATAELCYTDSAGKVQVVRKVNMPKQYSGNTCSFSMGTTIRHTVQVAASYFVRLTLTPNTVGMGKPLANEYKTVTPATATASGTTKTTRSDVTIIGTDGIKSIWGDGGFLANRNGVKIRGSLWVNGKLVTTS